MAEVKQNNKAKSKKSSKVLDEKQTLTNDELLEQIINKKKNKKKSSGTSVKKSTTSKSSGPKKKVEKKVDTVSSDDIYEKIKAKRTIKKRPVPKKKEEDKEKVVSEDTSKKLTNIKNVDKDFTKAIKEINEENTDLIITREIRFDDLSSDLKNKKTLDELRSAIEEYDKLDGDKFESSDFKDDIELLPSIRYSNYKLKKTLVIIGMVILLIIFLVGVVFGFSKISDEVAEYNVQKEEEKRILEEQKRIEEEARRKEKLYNDCINRKATDADYTLDILSAQKELTDYIKKNYSASVSYEDLTYGYTFNYNENIVYYAASTVKALGALYIYTNAAEGNINLDDTITYTSRFKVSYSSGVSKHKLGSKIKIRDLVKYSIIYSDNSAHQMLISYIGKSKLKEFGKSLGAKNTLNGGDNFGNTSSADGLIYMKAVNNFIENNGELGEELKGFFVTSQQKELSVNNLDVAHKYGLYKKYYHNMGIVYDEKPYVVSIMTLEGTDQKEKAVKNISTKVYELHNLFKTNRENVCKIEIYGE
ncbi:MAG: serine hydrolase [Bacilli bacterium]|nr:serine hydrolase [Bacilli bacterium]